MGNKWVSVKDSLPDFDEKVLVFGEQKGMNPQMGGAYVSISKRQDLSKISMSHRVDRMQDENQFYMMSYVTHWMPLPPAPTSKKRKSEGVRATSSSGTGTH